MKKIELRRLSRLTVPPLAGEVKARINSVHI